MPFVPAKLRLKVSQTLRRLVIFYINLSSYQLMYIIIRLNNLQINNKTRNIKIFYKKILHNLRQNDIIL